MEPIRDANGKTAGDLWREKQEAEKAEMEAKRQALIDAYEAKKGRPRGKPSGKKTKPRARGPRTAKGGGCRGRKTR